MLLREWRRNEERKEKECSAQKDEEEREFKKVEMGIE